MPNELIVIRAMETAIILPILCLIATFIIAFFASYISYKKSEKVIEIGLKITLLSFVVSWIVVIVNLLSTL